MTVPLDSTVNGRLGAWSRDGEARARRARSRRALAAALWRLIAPMLLTTAAMVCFIAAAFLIMVPVGLAVTGICLLVLDTLGNLSGRQGHG